MLELSFEVCPISNILIGTVNSFQEHPMPKMVDLGLRVTLSTDDPGIFRTSLKKECICCSPRMRIDSGRNVGVSGTGLSIYIHSKVKDGRKVASGT